MILGQYLLDGASGDDLAVDRRYTRIVTFNAIEDHFIAKLNVYVDGAGSDGGDQLIRGVVYAFDESEATPESLLAESGEVTIPSNAEPFWAELVFPIPPRLMVGDAYQIGLHAGENSNGGQLYSLASGTKRVAVDSYSDGAEPLFGAFSYVAGTPLVFATTCPVYDPPDVEDAQFARLPHQRAQFALEGRPESAGTDTGSALRVSLSWHGTYEVDPERGSFVVARSGSDFAELVGERLRISVGPPTSSGALPDSVVVYCHAEAALDEDEDLSLPAPLFARLAPLSTETVSAIAEVVL